DLLLVKIFEPLLGGEQFLLLGGDRAGGDAPPDHPPEAEPREEQRDRGDAVEDHLQRVAGKMRHLHFGQNGGDSGNRGHAFILATSSAVGNVRSAMIGDQRRGHAGSTRCWYSAGTPKYAKISAMTKMLSTLRDFSMT